MKQLFIKYFTVVLVAMFVFTANTYSKVGEIKEYSVKSASICGYCKDKIETELKKLDGFVSSDINLETKMLKIKYDASKTNEAKIKGIIDNICTSATGNKTKDHKCGDASNTHKGCDKSKVSGCGDKSKVSGCCDKSKTSGCGSKTSGCSKTKKTETEKPKTEQENAK